MDLKSLGFRAEEAGEYKTSMSNSDKSGDEYLQLQAW